MRKRTAIGKNGWARPASVPWSATAFASSVRYNVATTCSTTDDDRVRRRKLFEMMACINRHRPGYMADAIDAMDLKSYCQLRGCKLDNWYETVRNDYLALLEEHIEEEESPCRAK